MPSRLLFLAFLLVAGLVGNSAHAVSSPDEHQARSKDDRSSTLLVRVIRDAKFVGFPDVCSDSSSENNQGGLVCMVELYEAKVKVLRHFGGPPTERELIIRFTAHSFHAVWKRDVRFLLEVVPFDDNSTTGHFATYWDWENKNGEFCKAEDSLNVKKVHPVEELYARGLTRISAKNDKSWSEGSRLKCINGNEK
ncbi:hypothetical protein [Parasphingorhabdus sp.]|uniref:hypothetical protein n=1 Tax=Parasphingorhabdus sp. TaxID=2709688 RepID=UPI003A936A05